MNIFELLVFVAFVAVVTSIARFLGSLFGINPWYIGPPLGIAAIGLLVAWSRHAQRTHFPACVRGCCTSDDYDGVSIDSRGIIYKCKCGHRYLQRGARLQLLSDDGRAVPFKRRLAGRWVDDHPNESGPAEG